LPPDTYRREPTVSESATAKAQKKHVIEIREDWCKGCNICVEFCKPGVLEMKGLVAVVVNEEACTGCLQCELLCPDFAIKVT
jgi:2-oxoglutarate ferredoxin oxidoreductase subunit delta